jgi:hypothetical protein
MLPGMTVGGEKEAVAPGGRSVADIVTDPPGVTLNGVCGADTVYTGGALLTVRARGEEFEAANPTLPEYTAVNE